MVVRHDPDFGVSHGGFGDGGGVRSFLEGLGVEGAREIAEQHVDLGQVRPRPVKAGHHVVERGSCGSVHDGLTKRDERSMTHPTGKLAPGDRPSASASPRQMQDGNALAEPAQMGGARTRGPAHTSPRAEGSSG
jgi:hypothetical protein